jgi:hypothetical protein
MPDNLLLFLIGWAVGGLMTFGAVFTFSYWMQRRTRTVYVSARGNSERSGVWLDSQVTGGIRSVKLEHGEVVRVEIVAAKKIPRPDFGNVTG